MLNKLFIHNWCAILYFNFKMLPFKQAIRLPFDFYGKVRFVNLNGTITIKSDKLKVGMIKIGAQGSDMFSRSESVLDLRGQIIIEGRLVLGCGSSLICLPKSTLTFGHDVVLGAHSLIYCQKSISFEEQVLTSWNCQFMDSDTHDIFDLATGESKPNCQEIIIGSHVWIGNNVAINKGTHIVSNTIVASHSLCNKDYSKYGEYCILAGTPVKVIANNKKWEK